MDGDFTTDVVDLSPGHGGAPGSTRCLFIKGGVGDAKVDRNWAKGPSRPIGASTPASISFYVKTNSSLLETGVMFLTDDADRIALVFHMRAGGLMGIEEELINYEGTLTRAASANVWYKVELTFNWPEQRFDFLVDGEMIARNVPFEDPNVRCLGRYYLSNSHEESETWWDEIAVVDDAQPELSIDCTDKFVEGHWRGTICVDSACMSLSLAAYHEGRCLGRSPVFGVELFERGAIAAANATQLSEDMGELLLSGDTADVHFVIGQKRLPAHKCILSARCAHFRNMFASGMREAAEGEITITDVSEDAFLVVLEYIYKGLIKSEMYASIAIQVR